MNKGFTLFEMLVVVAIIGILMAIAYPAYTNYIISSRRTDGQIALTDLATRMEIYFTQHNTYEGATLSAVGMPQKTVAGYYELAIDKATNTAYILQATPLGAQADDTVCAKLIINQLGQKKQTGTGTSNNCW